MDLSTSAKANNKNQMKDIAAQYFKKMHSFSAASGGEVKALRAAFAEALPQDHLRFVKSMRIYDTCMYIMFDDKNIERCRS